MSKPKPFQIDDALLRRFAEGRLDSEAELSVAVAIEKSSELQARMAAISSDGFLDRVKEIATAGQILNSVAPAQQKATASIESSSPTLIEGVPQELVESPDYQVLKELGRGGMGVVYAAKYLPMDRMEVLKVLNDRMVQKEAAKQRFISEMKAIGKLNHPFIATAYQRVVLPTQLVFSMEYVPGIDLHKFVQKYHPLPIPVACTLTSHIATALQHAHSRKMVHRDIKPSNVMVFKEDGKLQIKILDFGLAKATSEQEAEGLTANGTMLGTPEYMAPEQALDAASADIRADIYSLGCTLYHLLMGKPPFTGTYQSVLMAHAQKEADYISFERLDVPVELSEVVAKMMAKEPSKRFQTPKAVTDALKPFIGSEKLNRASATKSSAKIDTKLNLASPSRDTSVEIPAKPVATEPLTNPEQSIALSIANLKIQDQSFSRHSKTNLGQTSGSRPSRRKVSRALAIMCSGIFVALAFAGTLMLKTTEGTVVVENLPADAEVLVDDEIVELVWNEGRDRASVYVKPGTRTVEVRSGGLLVAGETVTIENGDEQTITVGLANSEPAVSNRESEKVEAGNNPATLPDFNPIQILEGHKARVMSVAFTPDGTRLASGSNGNCLIKNMKHCGPDNSVRIWSVESGKQIRCFDFTRPRIFGVQQLCLSRDGKYVVACASWDSPHSWMDSTVYLWNIDTGEARKSFKIGQQIFLRDVTFSEDNTTLSLSFGNHVRSWDSASSPSLMNDTPVSDVILTSSTEHDAANNSGYSALCFSSDGRLMIGGSKNGSIRIWDVKSGVEVSTLSGHLKTITAATTSLDGKFLLSCAHDYSMRLWELETGRELLHVSGLESKATCVALSPDSTKIMTGSEDGSVEVYDASTGQRLIHFAGHRGRVNSVAFSPTDSLAASAGNDTKIKLWRLSDTGSSDIAAPSTTLSPAIWVHESGFFEQTSPDLWNEFSPNGRDYHFKEVARNAVFVELAALEGDTSTRFRLFDDHAEFANSQRQIFTHLFEGWWHMAGDETRDDAQHPSPLISSGTQFSGKKTWTTLSGGLNRGTVQAWEMRIDRTEGSEFWAEVKIQGREEPRLVEGSTHGEHIQWASPDFPGHIFRGKTDGTDLSAVYTNGTITASRVAGTGSSPEAMDDNSNTIATTKLEQLIQPGSIWRSNESAHELLILSREADEFRGRIQKAPSVLREVRGTIQGDRISWLGKDVHDIGSSTIGGDHVGSIRQESEKAVIELDWRDSDRSGTLVLHAAGMFNPPQDAFQLGDRYFKVFNRQLNWLEARDECTRLGGTLAKVDAEEIHSQILQQAQAEGVPEVWLGATDEATEGSWQWIDGSEMTFSRWEPSQPNNKLGSEHYALLIASSKTPELIGTWCDQPLVSTQHQPGFVCEWRIAHEEPSND